MTGVKDTFILHSNVSRDCSQHPGRLHWVVGSSTFSVCSLHSAALHYTNTLHCIDLTKRNISLKIAMMMWQSLLYPFVSDSQSTVTVAVVDKTRSRNDITIISALYQTKMFIQFPNLLHHFHVILT